MKAPETIYLQMGPRYGDIVPSDKWSDNPMQGYDNVEYIRADIAAERQRKAVIEAIVECP